jgi:hypothetical protein
MYNLRPPNEAVEWHLGLILEICFLIGLGKKGVIDESWEEPSVCEILSKNQIRHWWKSPPKKKKTLQRFIELLTQGEPFSNEWKALLEYAIKNNFERGKQKEEVFGVNVFDKTDLQNVILPKLKEMHSSDLEDVHRLHGDIPLPNSNAAGIKSRSSSQIVIITSSLIILTILALWLKPFHGNKYEFRNVFREIKFCRETDFEETPGNNCQADISTFTTNDPKIYLSFESIERLEGLPEINLQWLRNGELLYERARPWIDAFAIDLKYASTHIKMQKFDSLPPEWAEPGRYHVRFFLENEFVDEAGFVIINHED